jgi:hypothetical protein
MQSLAPSLPPVRADAPEEIPVLDLGGYLAGDPGANQKSQLKNQQKSRRSLWKSPKRNLNQHCLIEMLMFRK